MNNTTCTHDSNYIRKSDWYPNDRGVDFRYIWCHKCGEELGEEQRTTEGY